MSVVQEIGEKINIFLAVTLPSWIESWWHQGDPLTGNPKNLSYYFDVGDATIIYKMR